MVSEVLSLFALVHLSGSYLADVPIYVGVADTYK